MYVYVCACMCMYVYVCVCMYMYVCVYSYVCVCMCMYACMDGCMYVCLYGCIYFYILTCYLLVCKHFCIYLCFLFFDNILRLICKHFPYYIIFLTTHWLIVVCSILRVWLTLHGNVQQLTNTRRMIRGSNTPETGNKWVLLTGDTREINDRVNYQHFWTT